LALVEQDNERAQLLRRIADEADRGVLFTVEHSRHDKIEIPIKSGDGKKWLRFCANDADDPARDDHGEANWRAAIEHFHKCEACGGWFDMRDLGALPHPACDQVQ
jgi:hypothetical protein